jgi:DNA invertase Pin-like site-specific DNA recombinase
LQHLLQITEELRKHKTALVVPEQGIDTSEDSSAGELQLNVLAAVAQFERRIIVERINAGLAAAREHGTKSGKPFGRPRTLNRHISAVAKLRRRGLSERKIAAELKIKPGSMSAIVRNLKESGQ